MHEIELPVKLPFRYLFVPGEEKNKKDEILIFLHGYSDSAKSQFKRVFQGKHISIPMLIPNGPFPLPIKTQEGYKESYAWYFADYSQSKKIIISPHVAINMVEQLIHHIDFVEAKKTIVGFSQGGFLAPLLARKLKNVVRVIGIGTDFDAEDYTIPNSYKIYCIHGSNDEIFPIEETKKHFEERISGGFQGEFFNIPHMTHSIDHRVAEVVKKILHHH